MIVLLSILITIYILWFNKVNIIINKRQDKRYSYKESNCIFLIDYV